MSNVWNNVCEKATWFVMDMRNSKRIMSPIMTPNEIWIEKIDETGIDYRFFP